MAEALDGAVLRHFLYPRGIAVIGASAAAHKAGGRRWLSALAANDKAELYPISVSADSLNGYKVYRSLRDVPNSVDLAVVMVPSAAVGQAIGDCAAVGAKAVVVVSAGFGETGDAGRAAEAGFVATLRASGARMLGPNSAGVFSAGGGVNTLGWSVPKGHIGLITQSGNMALTFTHHARAKRAGFSCILALGNAADLKLSELVGMLLRDDSTRSILIYCEGFAEGDGRRLVEVLRAAERRKPVVILKPGRSEAGCKAAQSHTGSLAGDDEVADAALRDAGAVRAAETEEAFDLALALSAGKELGGRDIAVLSDGGGHATIVSDCAGRHGLRLTTFGPETLARLQAVLPARSGTQNPVDFAGVAESEPNSIPQVLRICLDDPNVHGIILAGHFGGYHLMTDHEPTRRTIAQIELNAARQIAAAAAESIKPIIVHSDHAERGLETLAPIHEAGIPIYAGLESAAKAMAVLANGGQSTGDVQRFEQRSSQGDSGEEAGRLLLEPDARQRLAAAGVAMPPFKAAATAAAAQAAFIALGSSAAMKLVSKRAAHKSDIGGVVLGIDSPDEAERAFMRLIAVGRGLGDPGSRVLITPMIGGGVECFIGAKNDSQFGPVIFFGAGGVLVEVLRDVTCKLAPFDDDEARALIARTKIARLLGGYRGTAAADLASLARLIASLSRYVASAPDLVELDLNPVIVNGTGAHIADARMVVR